MILVGRASARASTEAHEKQEKRLTAETQRTQRDHVGCALAHAGDAHERLARRPWLRPLVSAGRVLGQRASSLTTEHTERTERTGRVYHPQMTQISADCRPLTYRCASVCIGGSIASHVRTCATSRRSSSSALLRPRFFVRSSSSGSFLRSTDYGLRSRLHGGR
jgi:hypothetical protein